MSPPFPGKLPAFRPLPATQRAYRPVLHPPVTLAAQPAAEPGLHSAAGAAAGDPCYPPAPDPPAAPVLARIALGAPPPVQSAAAAGNPPEPAQDAGRDLLRLVLTLVEFLRRLMETQALRRFEAGVLTAAEEDRLGTGLAACEEVVQALCTSHGIDPRTLTLDLGPLGRLM